MSVKYYSRKNPHPGGFIGFRVTVMVNGEYRQKWFGCAKGGYNYKEAFILAHKLNARWLQEQYIHRRQREIQCRPTVRNKTPGVKGIYKRTVYSRDKKGNPKAYANDRYVVQISHKGRLYNKTFPQTEKGWEEAVRFVAKTKGLPRWRHLIERRP